MSVFQWVTVGCLAILAGRSFYHFIRDRPVGDKESFSRLDSLKEMCLKSFEYVSYLFLLLLLLCELFLSGLLVLSFHGGPFVALKAFRYF